MNIDYILIHNFNPIAFSKKVLTFLMTSAKFATLELLKIKAFWNKGHDVITFVHDINNKIFLPDSSYTADVVKWQKFSNSSNSMRKITITSIL